MDHTIKPIFLQRFLQIIVDALHDGTMGIQGIPDCIFFTFITRCPWAPMPAVSVSSVLPGLSHKSHLPTEVVTPSA